MSLQLIINEKTIKIRYGLLSSYLKNNNIGDLVEDEQIYFKHIFEKYYTPDEEYTKFNASQISNVAIVKNTHHNKCFSILVDNIWYPTSIKRLAGSNRKDKANLMRSLRNAIDPQIQSFRECNLLNPNDICPITNKTLGYNAEVDHKIPFYVLADEWVKSNPGVCYVYVLEKFEYILQEPFLANWCNFHLKNSILRWVSKEGNKFAHKLYSSD
jgi:hypothetical protein